MDKIKRIEMHNSHVREIERIRVLQSACRGAGAISIKKQHVHSGLLGTLRPLSLYENERGGHE